MNIFEIDNIWLFLAILPLVSFMYAAVGHGGASGYLAMMYLFGFQPDVMKPTALLLNLFVAAIAFISYARMGHFNRKLFLSFAFASIPLAYLGGTIEVNTTLYKVILGVLLVFAVMKMLNFFGKESEDKRPVKIWQGMAVGGAIGFFSGLIGIGGGIILSPVILLMRWGHMKEAAAVSALFIWVNSAAGMAGQVTQGVTIEPHAFLLVGVAVAGGFLGGYYGSLKFNNVVLKKVLASVLIFSCLKLFGLFDYLHLYLT